jgi:hypothetical protein
MGAWCRCGGSLKAWGLPGGKTSFIHLGGSLGVDRGSHLTEAGHEAFLNSPSLFTLDPKATAKLISKPVAVDSYEWCQVLLEAWVSLAGSSARTCATCR